MSSIDYVLYPFFEINQNNPNNIGYVPQIQVPQILQQDYPYIVVTIKQYLSDNARRNPARTYVFNIMAANDWFNPDFDKFISEAIDYAYYLLVNKIAFNLNEAIQRAIDDICIYITSYFILSVPMVQTAMLNINGPGIIADCQADVNKMTNVFNTINNSRNNPYRSNMPQNQPSPPSYRNNQPTNGFPRNAVTQNTAFNAVPVQSAFSIAGSRSPVEVVARQVTPVALVSAPVKTTDTNIVSDVQWYPNVIQRNPPAYRTEDQEPVVKDGKTMVGGQERAFPVVQISEIQLMDRKAHTLVDKAINKIQPKEEVLKDIKKQTTKNTSYLTKSDITEGSFIDTSLVMFSTLEEAIKQIKLNNYKDNTASMERSIITNFAAFYNPVITDFKIDSRILDTFFTEIADTNLSFDAVKTNIIDWLNSNDNAKIYIGIHLDKLFTDFINKMIINKLSFPDLSIDSFIDDYDDLKKFLSEHSSTYIPAIKQHEHNLIKSIYQHTSVIDDLCSVVEQEPPLSDSDDNVTGTVDANDSKVIFTDAEILDSIGYNRYGNDCTNIFYRLQLATITSIALSDKQLGISMYDGLGSIVTSRYTPDAYQILDYLFDYYETKVIDVPPNHYLVTSDNVVYEVHLGLLNDKDKVYLINKHVI